MTYYIGIIGRNFLVSIEVKFGVKKYFDPGTLFESLSGEDKKEFEISIYNSNFYLRAANEVMKKLFTPEEKEELKELIKNLEENDTSLISSASQKVNEIIKEHENDSVPLYEFGKIESEEEFIKFEKMLKGITVKVFKEIPPYALNLLGLIKVKRERFPESYNNFERTLNELNEKIIFGFQKEVKGYFSKALEELKSLVEDVVKEKKKKKPDETKKEDTSNSREENVENETPNKQTPSPQPEPVRGDKHNPTDSNEKSETQNNSENNENTNEPNNDTSSDSTDLQNLKTQVISEITAALNQTPPLTSSDLSSKYQGWENEINNLSDKNQINFLKVSVLFDIQDQRKEKIKKQTTDEVSEIINSNLQKAQNPDATVQEKKEVLVENEQYEGQPAYEEAKTKEQIKNLKKEVARNNLAEYRDKVISDLTTKLNINHLKESELDPKTKSEIEMLKKETDPDKLVEKEVKITQKIGQQGATKKITRFEKKVEVALESGNKTKINELKKQLIEFMKSNNVYYQAKKKEAQQLLKQLENGSTINNPDSSETLPFAAQIGLGMGAVLVVLFFTLLIWKKKRQAFFKAP